MVWYCAVCHRQNGHGHEQGCPYARTPVVDTLARVITERDEARTDNARLRLLVAELVGRKPVAPFEQTDYWIDPDGKLVTKCVMSGDEPLWRRTSA